jgi:protein-L-isoaspartate(D-aspartate) O-methyltransferase
MKDIQESASSGLARARLVADLRGEGAIHSEQVAQAFLSVPREVFVPFFFVQEGFTWIKRTADLYEGDAWIDAIYLNDALVTLIDEKNWPTSSSSAPIVMAMMLEVLEIQPGMRVLEIGTGSGYNAALLSSLVGDPSLVTTIDIEESLARSAEQVLHKRVGSVSVHVGDGRLGVPERAPYDRIVATASAPCIPQAWYEQLAPGGRLVMDLQGSLQKSGFLVVKKAADGQAEGHFDERYLHFMPLRPGDSLPTRPVSRLLRQPVVQNISLPDDQTASMLFGDYAFLWFLQWYASGTSLAKSKGGPSSQSFVTIIDATKETIIQLFQKDGQWVGQQRGGNGLWETIEQAYKEWISIGCPDLSAYYVEWDEQQGSFQLLLRQGLHSVSFKI